MSEIQKVLKTFEEFSRAVIKLADKKYDNTIREEREKSGAEMNVISQAYLKGAKGEIERRRRIEQMNWMQFYGITPVRFCASRLERARKITLEEIKEKIKKEKAGKEEMRRQQKGHITKPAEPLTISERAVNYLYGQLKMKGIARFDSSGQELNHKLLWAVDFLSSKLSKKCGFDKGKKKEIVLFENALTFFNFMGDIKEGLVPSKYTFVDIQFKASEVRDWLGFTSDEISLKDIVNLFRGLQRVIFEAEGEPILRDAEKKEWVKTTVSDTLFSLRRDNLGIISNRWKTKDVILNLRFQNIMSWLFIANLSCGKDGLITLPKKAIHELDGFGQNVLRWLRLWKKPREINVIELANIAGLKYKEVYRLILALERILNDLKEKDYVTDWEATGKGKNTQYVIVKG